MLPRDRHTLAFHQRIVSNSAAYRTLSRISQLKTRHGLDFFQLFVKGKYFIPCFTLRQPSFQVCIEPGNLTTQRVRDEVKDAGGEAVGQVRSARSGGFVQTDLLVGDEGAGL